MNGAGTSRYNDLFCKHIYQAWAGNYGQEAMEKIDALAVA
jgi:hypothetical protein